MRRAVSRPVLLSIALHATVLSALLLWRPPPSSSDSPRVLSFRLVQLEEGTATEAGRDPDAPDTTAESDATSSRAPPAESRALASPQAAAAAARSQPAAAADDGARGPDRARHRRAASKTSTPPIQADAAAVPPPPKTPPADVAPAPPPRTASAAQEHAQSHASPLVPPSRAALATAARAAIENDSQAGTPSIGAPAAAAPQPLPAPDEPARAAPTPARASAEPPRATQRIADAERRSLEREVEKLAERDLEALEARREIENEPTASRGSPSQPSEPSIAFKHKGRQYVATFAKMPAEDNMHLDRVVMTISTERDGHRLSTKLHLKRMAFSNFAQFVDHWDPDVQIHDDRIDGRFHSNSEIYVSKSHGVEPEFLGKVTTARSVDTSYSEGFISRAKVFLGGLETSVPPILLPRRFTPFAAGAVDSKRVQRFEHDARIRFYANGSYGWRYLDSGEPERRRRLPDAPFYLVAAEKAALRVEGTVNGKVLVYSPDKIVIEGDLRYADDAEAHPDSDDYLGLVSDKNVEIAGPEVTGPGDLHLEASIYARRWFDVKDYMHSGHATLSLFGSLTAGSLTATEPRYRTELHFDRRFESSRPPGFPVSDRYEIATWDGRWTMETEAPAGRAPMVAADADAQSDGSDARPVSGR